MPRSTSGPTATLLFALGLAAGLCSLFAGDIRLDGDRLRLGNARFEVRGVGYGAESGPSQGCAIARDLPLAATMGANTVRTYKQVPAGDQTLTSVLETTGLYWLADFPLDSF